MHAVFDTQTLEKQKRKLSVEQHEQQVQDWIAEQQNNVVVMDNFDLSPANMERQVGQSMFANVLEEKLKRLNANFVFEVNPFNTSKKALYQVRDGKKFFLCAYESGVMPEHSIMSVKDHEALDPTFTKRHLNRKDLPKSSIVNGEVVFEGQIPGLRKTQILWHEAIRGWRTVLIKLVQHNVVTPAQVESVFGIDGRPEWAAKMGKRTDLKTIL